jgi:flagellar biosynthesis/type III secretory pathway M-ring protein FliF/YscJ
MGTTPSSSLPSATQKTKTNQAHKSNIMYYKIHRKKERDRDIVGKIARLSLPVVVAGVRLRFVVCAHIESERELRVAQLNTLDVKVFVRTFEGSI